MVDISKQQLIDRLVLALTELQSTSEMADQTISESLGLNRTDARCVGYLITHGPMTVGELAEFTGVKPGALTFAVDRLRKTGYARRRNDPADRRKVIVEAADKALRIAETAWRETSDETEADLREYTSEQLEFLTEFLRKQVELQRRHADRIRKGAWNEDAPDKRPNGTAPAEPASENSHSGS